MSSKKICDVNLCNPSKQNLEKEWDESSLDKDFSSDDDDLDYFSENNKESSDNDDDEKGMILEAPQKSTEETLATLTEKKNRRWKKAYPEQWKRNIKHADIIRGKNPKHSNCEKCRFKCKDKFTEEQRLKMCKDFWKLSYQRQKDFVLKAVMDTEIQRSRVRSKIRKVNRNVARSYFLENENSNVRVCRDFFCGTLSISYSTVKTAFKHKGPTGVFSKKDERGTSKAANKTSDENIARIKDHIESFPTVESHYCRKTSKRMYLDANLSISKMYSLFLDKYKSDTLTKLPSLTTYKKVFGECYNLSFFHPKKDQCQACEKGKETQNENYLAHLKRKDECSAAKSLDKERAIKEPNFMACTFDLQSVLQIPSSDISPMYYSRKLCAYNLTIYNAAPPNDAFCFFWTEIDGKRGSNEIGSCLYKYLHQLPPEIKEVSFFSDTCSGQNRNKNISILFLHLVQVLNLDIIEHKFLESGHSYMEVDSMHSAIEKQKKNVPVYTIQDWLTIFRLARSKRLKSKANPYNIAQMRYTDFLDLSKLSEIIKNKNLDENGEKVNWLKVKSFRYQKIKPGVMEYKYDHNETYKHIRVFGKGRPINLKEVSIKKVYKKSLTISIEKKKDLLNLCKSGAIPDEFHHWYRSLKASKTTKNKAAEPDIHDDSESDQDL